MWHKKWKVWLVWIWKESSRVIYYCQYLYVKMWIIGLMNCQFSHFILCTSIYVQNNYHKSEKQNDRSDFPYIYYVYLYLLYIYLLLPVCRCLPKKKILWITVHKQSEPCIVRMKKTIRCLLSFTALFSFAIYLFIKVICEFVSKFTDSTIVMQTYHLLQ